ITVDGKSQTAPFELKLDPRVKVSAEDLKKQFDVLLEIRDQLTRMYDAVDQIQDVRSQLEGLRKRMLETDANKPLLESSADLDQKLVAVRDSMLNLKITSNEASLAYPPQADAGLALLAMTIGSGTDSAPTEAALREYGKLRKQSDELLARWTQLQQ